MKTWAITLAIAAAMMCTGCSDKKSNEDSGIKNPEAEVCSFDDFQYLMFTENQKSVIRDVDGNEYLLQTDGYYYDNIGKRITYYGVGDVETAKLGGSSGAVLKSNISDSSIKGNNNIETTITGEGGVTDESTEQLTEPVGEYEETTIADWDSAKAEIMSNKGIMPSTEAHWHGQSDDLSSYKAGEGNNTLVPNKSYNTAINVGSSIPGVLNLTKVVTGSNCSVSGSLQLDASAFNEYMKGIYGDVQMNDAGEEVPADYSTYLKEQYCSFAIVATDGFNVVTSDVQNQYFTEEYTVEFSVNLSVPEGYTTYLTIQDTPYNL